ncbi:[protein release factor]-glutamine N5-methyltransferase [Sphaerotilus hippei]|uniref:Release factor glutamine methyltransferase n=1 Tax=Sphaerotilus hippei TaxID=744406 RepID=A0A318HCJ7_9BURK|nr:peptide chain release factor N(5)-glutamine methyltransferase [Sphaerotilus hippei]PXW97001.1 [protein release factor]-glutamine N5-methyltransferase [Sphaerotilus hippei]
MSAPCTVADAMRQGRARGLDRADLDALLGHLLQRDRTWLICHDDTALDPAQQARWAELLARRADGVPVAYLTGWHEFHGLRLEVTHDVLDPRPDTETLVDWGLERLAAAGPGRPRALDLGTGSGAVALALRHGAPTAEVSAIDLSAAALAVARRNGERLGLPVRWLQGSWLAPVAGERFELIVSNPPYIAEGDPHLGALRHEPGLALTSGPDGLDAIRHLVQAAAAHLTPDGWLLFEHGWDQADAVAALLETRGYRDIGHRHDLAGHRRCTGARRSMAVELGPSGRPDAHFAV